VGTSSSCPGCRCWLRSRCRQIQLSVASGNSRRSADRGVAAVAEVVPHGPVGGGADVRRHVGPGAAVVSAHVDRGVSGVGVAIDVSGTGAATVPHGTGIGPVVGGDVSAVAAVVPAHPPSLGG
jgi:hypothetical protein